MSSLLCGSIVFTFWTLEFLEDCHSTSICMGSGDLNPGLQAQRADALPTELSRTLGQVTLDMGADTASLSCSQLSLGTAGRQSLLLFIVPDASNDPA